jgi:acyl carrier protein
MKQSRTLHAQTISAFQGTDMTDYRSKIVEAILDVTRPEKPDLSDHSKPLLAGTLDSLDFASVLMALEDEFGVVLADEDTEQLGSIDQLTTFIERAKAA